MLEILFLTWFTRRIGALVTGKGAAAGGYKVLAVALWFGGEVVGVLVASALGAEGAAVYLAALLCASVGAFFAWAIANGVQAAPEALRAGVGTSGIASSQAVQCKWCNSIVPADAPRCPICAGDAPR